MALNRKEYQRQWSKDNPDKVKSKKKTWETKHRDKHLEYRREYYNRTKEVRKKQVKDYYSKPENRRKKILYKARERAKEEGFDFNLELSDIIIPEYCPYLGIKITNDLDKGQLMSNSSIDRIDPSKGYIKGNIQIISRKANNMKSNATLEELIIFAKNILKLYVNNFGDDHGIKT